MEKQPNSHDCFVCGVRNGAGLRVRFYETRDEGGRPEVLARFVGRDVHQGYPGRMHGGVATGILDETIGRAVNAGEEGGDGTVWGVAVGLEVRFRRPVPLGVELEARGRITRRGSRLFEGSGEIYLPDGEVAVTAEGRYAAMPLDRIAADLDPASLGWRVYDDDELA